jgi:catechol 2,3-dioxygenase-like lactoylglutathione lyase family enzyme
MAKLRHIAIAAKDPDAMADFYVKAFDFKIVPRTTGRSPMATT